MSTFTERENKENWHQLSWTQARLRREDSCAGTELAAACPLLGRYGFHHQRRVSGSAIMRSPAEALADMMCMRFQSNKSSRCALNCAPMAQER